MRRLSIAWVAVAAIAAACSSGASNTRENEHVQSVPFAASTFAAAVSAAELFFSYQLEGSAPDLALYDSIQVCPPNSMTAETLWAASFEILSAARIGDTVLVRAEFKSVAMQRPSVESDTIFDVQPRVRVDTLNWRVLRGARGWFGVCGVSVEQVALRSYGRDSNVRFLNGSTRRSLDRQIDSIRGGSLSRP